MVVAVSDNPLDNSLDNLIDNLSDNSMDNSLSPTLLDLGDGTGNISSTSSTSSLFSSCGSPQKSSRIICQRSPEHSHFTWANYVICSVRRCLNSTQKKRPSSKAIHSSATKYLNK